MSTPSISKTLLAFFALAPLAAAAAEPNSSVRRVGSWQLADTANFSICTPHDVDPLAVGRACETLRGKQLGAWIGDGDHPGWSPRCYVVWHPAEAGYVREVGKGSEGTRGSSLVTIDRRRVTARRIDLRGDRPDPLKEALPHELTHILVADFFLDKPCPRWAEEGLAVMADSHHKSAGHRRDLVDGWRREATLATPELLRLDGYPPAHQRAVFYGQSLSLVELLVAREDPATFLAFLRRAAESDYDTALKSSYGISDVGELDRLWKAQVTGAASPHVAQGR